MSLEQELKDFEKELSLLLVRFMKIYDAVEKSKKAPAVPPDGAAPKAPPREPADRLRDALRAYQ